MNYEGGAHSLFATDILASSGVKRNVFVLFYGNEEQRSDLWAAKILLLSVMGVRVSDEGQEYSFCRIWRRHVRDIRWMRHWDSFF